MGSQAATVEFSRIWTRFFVSDLQKAVLAPPAGLEPATRCLEGVRSFLNRNQGDSYLVGDCSRQQAHAQHSHRFEQSA